MGSTDPLLQQLHQKQQAQSCAVMLAEVLGGPAYDQQLAAIAWPGLLRCWQETAEATGNTQSILTLHSFAWFLDSGPCPLAHMFGRLRQTTG